MGYIAALTLVVTSGCLAQAATKSGPHKDLAIYWLGERYNEKTTQDVSACNLLAVLKHAIPLQQYTVTQRSVHSSLCCDPVRLQALLHASK